MAVSSSHDMRPFDGPVSDKPLRSAEHAAQNLLNVQKNLSRARARKQLPPGADTLTTPTKAPEVMPPLPIIPRDIGYNSATPTNDVLPLSTPTSHALQLSLEDIVKHRSDAAEEPNDVNIKSVESELGSLREIYKGTSPVTLEEFERDRQHYEQVADLLIKAWNMSGRTLRDTISALRGRLTAQAQQFENMQALPDNVAAYVEKEIAIPPWDVAVAGLDPEHHHNCARSTYHFMKRLTNALEARENRLYTVINEMHHSVIGAVLRPMSSGTELGVEVSQGENGELRRRVIELEKALNLHRRYTASDVAARVSSFNNKLTSSENSVKRFNTLISNSHARTKKYELVVEETKKCSSCPDLIKQAQDSGWRRPDVRGAGARGASLRAVARA